MSERRGSERREDWGADEVLSCDEKGGSGSAVIQVLTQQALL